tara:strand:- start:587 stop:877 length:291 start_codon:yes stop_codon:yes gene_type:complete
MDNVDKFLALFSEFEMVVTPLQKAQKVNKHTYSAGVNIPGKAKFDLEKELKRLTQEYKKAQKSFKHNKISKQDLFDFEWRIFELQEEIRRIDEDVI